MLWLISIHIYNTKYNYLKDVASFFIIICSEVRGQIKTDLKTTLLELLESKYHLTQSEKAGHIDQGL